MIFANAKRLEASWSLNDQWATNQRLELETDLIGAHILATNGVPPAQFFGGAESRNSLNKLQNQNVDGS
jgi:hypothetical protein